MAPLAKCLPREHKDPGSISSLEPTWEATVLSAYNPVYHPSCGKMVTGYPEHIGNQWGWISKLQVQWKAVTKKYSVKWQKKAPGKHLAQMQTCMHTKLNYK